MPGDCGTCGGSDEFISMLGVARAPMVGEHLINGVIFGSLVDKVGCTVGMACVNCDGGGIVVEWLYHRAN